VIPANGRSPTAGGPASVGTRRRDEARFDLNPDPAERRPRVAVPQPQAPAWPGDTITTSGFAITFADRLPVFNGSGQASSVYAGNPGTASAANANSTHAVSQYDIACFQVSQSH